jgi:AraC-like DNA-binding protein
MVSRWLGDLWLGGDAALLHGQAGETHRHAHHAHQLMLATQPITVQLQTGRLQQRRILIQSNQPHAIVDAPDDVLTIFAEPAALSANALDALPVNAAQPADEILRLLAGLPRRDEGDPRITTALAAIDTSLDGKIAAAALARQVNLSLSQLERLFGAQLGAPVRQLVRWRRLRLALRMALAGLTLTDAAHAAGFADSAHLSRTMRAVFGVRADHTLRGLRLRAID